MLVNALRGHLAEFGIVANRGPGGVKVAVDALYEASDVLPDAAHSSLEGLVEQLGAISRFVTRTALSRTDHEQAEFRVSGGFLATRTKRARAKGSACEPAPPRSPYVNGIGEGVIAFSVWVNAIAGIRFLPPCPIDFVGKWRRVEEGDLEVDA